MPSEGRGGGGWEATLLLLNASLMPFAMVIGVIYIHVQSFMLVHEFIMLACVLFVFLFLQ